jgi:hypothetical protein
MQPSSIAVEPLARSGPCANSRAREGDPLDRREIALGQRASEAFTRALEKPGEASPSLKRIMAQAAPWKA